MARMATLKGVEAFIQKLSNGFEYQIRCYKNLITGNLNLHKIVFLKKWNFLKGNLNFIVWQVICYQKFCRISDATLILADYFFLFHIELWHLVYLIFEKGIQNTMKKCILSLYYIRWAAWWNRPYTQMPTEVSDLFSQGFRKFMEASWAHWIEQMPSILGNFPGTLKSQSER